MRGIRGAITINENTENDVFSASRWLVTTMCRKNGISPEDIGAIILSATEDVTAAFPATGVRQIPGFDFVPLFDTRQIAVEGALPMCIRALILADTDKSQRDIQHIYLGGAANLRPDLRKLPEKEN